jgi:hypothetical protein
MKIQLPRPPIPENASAYAEMAVGGAKHVDNIDLDYSPESLEAVDGIIGRFHQHGVSAEQVDATLFAFGCYVVEVFIRNIGGTWRKEEWTEMRGVAGFFLVVDKICNPIGKVFNRLQEGEAENLPYFYHVFATGAV